MSIEASLSSKMFSFGFDLVFFKFYFDFISDGLPDWDVMIKSSMYG